MVAAGLNIIAGIGSITAAHFIDFQLQSLTPAFFYVIASLLIFSGIVIAIPFTFQSETSSQRSRNLKNERHIFHWYKGTSGGS